MAKVPRILVLGYNAWDVSVPVSAMPRPDRKCEVSTIRFDGGGPGATAAVALARLGAEVHLVTRFGDDLPGVLQRAELVGAGVDVSLSSTAVGFISPRAVILVQEGTGERTIFWSRGDLPNLRPEEVDTAWLDQADLFYTDGHETAAALVLARGARNRGLPVVMDGGTVREGSGALVDLVSDVIASFEFAPGLTGATDPVTALRELQRRGPAHVAATCGEGGVLALVEGRVRHVPAFAVPVVDTTGAGDAFHAGYAWARGQGSGFLECLEVGSAVAALKCREWGGRRGLPDAATVASFRREARRLPLPPEFAAWLD
jgi:sugar/nucleoside kinase (ribokinase family)